jgi:LysM repeat protein
MKKFLTLLLLIPSFVFAQTNTIMVEGTAGNLYVNHTAAPKENLYSIGRIYNASPKDIIPYNNSGLEKGLNIGQVIKVPLKEVNFTQTNKIAADEASIPLYHKLDAKENLYQVSTRFNKVPVATLKAWNNLADENVGIGQDLIIGYLKVKKELSPLAGGGLVIPTTETPTDVVTKEVVFEPPVIKADVVKAKPEPIAKKAVAPKVTKPVVEEAKAELEEKVAVVKETAPKPKPAVKDIVKPVVETTVEESESAGNARDFKGGVFKSIYNKEGEEETGIAGVFKSTSGWEDGKYYCLYNKAQQHTIVKITNKTTGKFVYAKVLDVMPDLKQNNNVQIRVSNAAADILGAGASNFECKIEY